MDIKRVVFDEMISRYKVMQIFEKNNIERTAQLMKNCFKNGGVVQLCGTGHAEEFVNELNFRAGGLAPMHALNVNDLFIRNLITEEEKADFYNHKENIKRFEEYYELTNQDMYIIVSPSANEPLYLEIAKKAKEKGQSVVLVCNRESIHLEKNKKSIFDYCDVVFDICAHEKDTLVNVEGEGIGQAWTTVANVMAQMITGEVYRLYREQDEECPILLSANLKGADVHNNSLTSPYGKRVR